ncbi:MAG: TIGR01841 family phasin, partial [Burkholderiales bacterium]|nr:TIGR01841 family phasin [Burkholderiales bacterium]
MMKSPEDLLKMQSEAFGASNAVMAKAVEQFEKLAALNLKAATDTFAQSTDQLKALLSAKDPQQAAKLLSEMAQPSSEALTTYAKEFFELSSKTGNELTAMAEKQIADGNRQLLTAVEL